jgi:ABC-2 type transport system ATP-binding protein
VSANQPALQVEGITKTFRVHHDKANSLKKLVTRGQGRYDDFVALQDVTFDVRDGEVFGVIGENGSGKSTLLKCMAGILVPNSGKVHVNRRMSALLELGAGFHPELSGRDNVFLNAAILGMGRRDIANRFDSIVEFSGLENFIDTPVKSYSTGMYVRLAFAVAINVDPQLLLIDEILAVGDVSFQQKCMEKFVDFRNEGRTIILVTHAMTSVRDMCDRAVWLEHGKVVGHGDPAELVELYTERMLGARSGDREGDQSVRYGTGEIQVHRVEIFVGGSNESVKRFRTGDDIRVKVHYRTAKRVPRPILAVAIESLGGALVTAPATRDVGLIPDFIDRDGTFEVEFKNVPLLPGTYDLHTSISDFNRQHIYDNLRVATRFDVMTGRSYETGGALITMSPSWTI